MTYNIQLTKYLHNLTCCYSSYDLGKTGSNRPRPSIIQSDGEGKVGKRGEKDGLGQGYRRHAAALTCSMPPIALSRGKGCVQQRWDCGTVRQCARAAPLTNGKEEHREMQPTRRTYWLASPLACTSGTCEYGSCGLSLASKLECPEAVVSGNTTLCA